MDIKGDVCFPCIQTLIFPLFYAIVQVKKSYDEINY